MENEIPGTRDEIPKAETYNKYRGDAGEIEIEAIEKHGTFGRMHFSGIPDGSLIEGDFVYTVKIIRFPRGTPKQAPMLAKIGN